ncbi:uncharacterized protein AB675_11230, partial [Cyphellophora attinorum]
MAEPRKGGKRARDSDDEWEDVEQPTAPAASKAKPKKKSKPSKDAGQASTSKASARKPAQKATKPRRKAADSPSGSDSSDSSDTDDEDTPDEAELDPSSMNLPSTFRPAEKAPVQRKLDNFTPPTLNPKLAKGPGLRVQPRREDRQFPQLLLPKEDPASLPSQLPAGTATGSAPSRTTDAARKLFQCHITPRKRGYVDLFNAAVQKLNPQGSLLTRRLSFLTLLNKSQIHARDKRSPKNEGNRGEATHKHMNYDQPPLSDLSSMMDHMAQRLLNGDKLSQSFLNGATMYNDFGLRIFTMCSGTEAPILALDMIQEALQRRGMSFNYKHVASAEIEPYKQGYIELNFDPPLLFRDVTDFTKDDGVANTAYGAQVAVPNNCHIVVAGSACVDYSNLNKNGKGFGQQGESWSTMWGVAHYCLKNRVPIVILENIKGAPWKKICKFWHDYCGYEVQAIFVDTKDFYLPQTRTRGYMVAINRSRAEEAGIDIVTALKDFVENVQALQYRASSPYTDIIYGNDSIESERSRAMMATIPSKVPMSQAWTLCAHRYAHLRSTSCFGSLRPYTNWNENGLSTLHELIHHEWGKKQRDRVLDTLDIAFLRYMLERDFDMTYKSRTIDLSQNIDREADSKHHGIVGCLTAAGMLYDTAQGGVINGVEALKLQGISTDDLHLGNLSMRQMIDLAGNAMTTTTVGAITLAAIAACTQGTKTLFAKPKHRSLFNKAPVIEPTTPLQYDEVIKSWQTAGLLNDTIAIGGSFSENDAAEFFTALCKQAYLTRQLCACEGVTGGTSLGKNVNFFSCDQCGHTACENCRGNPVHSYVGNPVVTSDRRPNAFISRMETGLPRSISFITFPESVLDLVKKASISPPDSARTGLVDSVQWGNGSWAQHLQTVEDRSGKDVIRVKKPRVPEEALQNALRACITGAFRAPFHFRQIKRGPAWKVEFESVAGKLELRFSDAENTSVCQWFLYAKCPSNEPLGGRLREHLRHPVAKMRPQKTLFDGDWQLCLPQHNKFVATVKGSNPQPAIQSVIGLNADGYKEITVFDDLEVSFTFAGTAGDRMPVFGMKKYNFKYLPKCGTAHSLLYKAGDTDPVYLFLDPWHLQDQKFDSMVMAKDHSRLPINDERSVIIKFASGWRPVVPQFQDSQHWEVACGPMENGPQLVDAVLGADANDSKVSIWYSQGTDYPLYHPLCEDASKPLFALETATSWEIMESFGNHAGALADQSLVIDLQDRRGKLTSLAWLLHALPIPDLVEGQSDKAAQNPCAQCSPEGARIDWKWARRSRMKGYALMPFEGNTDAAERQRKLKNRPLLSELHLNAIGGKVQMTFHFNIKSLVDRTAGPLQRSGPRGAPVTTSWKIMKYDINATAPSYKVPELMPLTEADGSSSPPVCFQRRLLGSQKLSLHWMREVEKGQVEWHEQNTYAHTIKALACKVVATASRKTAVKGGVIADGIGTGKTTVALAIVGDDIDRRSKPVPHEGRRGLRATVILMPKNLIEQWYGQAVLCFEQVRDAWPGKYTKPADPKDIFVLKISSMEELVELTIEDIDRAHILLVNYGIFDTAEYWEALKSLCGMPYVPDASGRATMQWLNKAMENIKKLCEDTSSFDDLDKLNDARDDLWANRDQVRAQFGGWNSKKDMKKIDFHGTGKAEKIMSVYPEAQETIARPDEKLPKLPLTGTVRVVARPAKPKRSHKDPSFYEENEDRKEKGLPIIRAAARRQVKLEAAQGKPVRPKKAKSAITIVPLLHLFAFRRLIIDEFQYLNPRMAAAAMALAPESRWLLSGTPPISLVNDVDQIARLIGTSITCSSDEAVIRGFFDKAQERKVSETSYVEEFEEYSNPTSIDTVSLHQQQATQFLSKFVRRNYENQEKHVEAEILISVKPNPLELAVYHLFFNVINYTTIRFSPKLKPITWRAARALAYKQRTDLAHADVQFPSSSKAAIEVAQRCSSQEMALICCHELAMYGSDFENELVTIEKLRLMLHNEVQGETTYLLQMAREAVWYWLEVGTAQRAKENDDLASWSDSVLQTGLLGDRDVTLLVDDVLGYADLRPSEPPGEGVENVLKNREHLDEVNDDGELSYPKFTQFDSKDSDVRNKELTRRTSDLRESSTRLVASVRMHRFVQSVHMVSVSLPVLCDSCGALHTYKTYSSVRIVSQCGHILCTECCNDDSGSLLGSCSAPDCAMPLSRDNVLKASSFFAPPSSRAQQVCGSRGVAIANLIGGIVGKQNRDPTDCVLVFLQYYPQVQELTRALEVHGIRYQNGCIRPGGGATAQDAAREAITKFKRVNMAYNFRQVDSRSRDPGLPRPFYTDKTAEDAVAATANRPRVLLLMLDSEDAAGWNLQVCSHVVFPAPYVQRDAFRRKAVVEQAVGRAFRFGQTKPVRVYRVVMEGTNE